MLAVGLTLMMAMPAAATISGRCEASANSQNVAFNSRKNPLKVKEHSSVSLLGKAPSPDGTVNYSLSYFDIRFATKTERFSQGFLRTAVPVDRYATYGVGSYDVAFGVITTDHRLCSGHLYLVVRGDPLKTAAGKAAATGAALGALGLVGSLVGGARARVPEGMTQHEDVSDEEAAALEKRSSEARREAQYGPAPTAEEVLVKWPWELCGFFLLPAIFLAMMAAATGSPERRVRVRWKPRLSFVGIGSGILFGISIIVLLQQYGLIFPTRTMGILGLVGGLLLGIVLPTCGRIRALKRAVRRLT